MSDDSPELAMAIAEANARAESNLAIQKVIDGLKEKVGGLRRVVKNQALIEKSGRKMIRAMEYSQWARRCCMEIDQGKRQPDEFRLAKKVAQRGIDLLNECMEEFPDGAAKIMPLVLKMLDQVDMIEKAMKEYGMV